MTSSSQIEQSEEIKALYIEVLFAYWSLTKESINRCRYLNTTFFER